ncbi:nucleotidyltransferase domain-containing protein [Candidatus Woesearchaeota archaeon]|nr:nucleotidyltransferase domain-containing protein [Candidatus Woesearchaeota archaeon]
MTNSNYYKDTEYKIIGELLKSPLQSKSMHEIAVTTGTAYPTVHKTIPELIKVNALTQETKGRANLVSIDLEHASTGTLSAAMFYEKDNLFKKHPSVNIISDDLEQALGDLFYILILFGSYAKGEEKKNSDFDLLFIIPSIDDKEKYQQKINKALSLHTNKQIDIIIVSTKDFLEMLNEKYTVGREAFMHGIILFGAEQYYKLVKEYVRTKGY